ncbi:hypothetical protein GY45DRAFT_1021047 [Cubamyces sp. BRFM 1775]|nr:hypothetical protein GY45DRAFT_1021047 [Cubamyces sp. BRFM 1775]
MDSKAACSNRNLINRDASTSIQLAGIHWQRGKHSRSVTTSRYVRDAADLTKVSLQVPPDKHYTAFVRLNYSRDCTGEIVDLQTCTLDMDMHEGAASMKPPVALVTGDLWGTSTESSR